MRRHWHKKPLLVRQALPGVRPPITPPALFSLAQRDDVESRLVVREGRRWQLRAGPLSRRALPPRTQAGWTLLVQGLDLHAEAARDLLGLFRFVPDARLDDLMLSYASDRGGVGPHIDAYDVFLLQVGGRRRWRIGRCARPTLRDDVPLKMLKSFEAEHDWVLDPGDMLYLPPGWAHEGSAVGADCMTASIGFRSPAAAELAQALLARLSDESAAASPRYRDARQAAVVSPAEVPSALRAFARAALVRAVQRPDAVERVLGEWLTEPKPQVWFERSGAASVPPGAGLVLDRRTRMAYDARHIFINGESYRAAGRDARLMRRMADERGLAPAAAAWFSSSQPQLLMDWLGAGWLHITPGGEHGP
jgi:50S ribosomal protein L16 3-hydroxylase